PKTPPVWTHPRTSGTVVFMMRLVRRLLSSITLVLLVSIWSVAAPARMPLIPFSGALQTDWTLADFDGDHNPDLAQAISHNAGTLYGVDIDLNGRGRVNSFTFANPEAWDIDLAAIDVDGDRDLDLVVSGRFRGQRLGVFINDGKGTFSKSTSNLYSE